MTTGKIDYRNGEVTYESDGNPFVIDIFYEGKIKALSNLGDKFLITEKKNRIFILRLANVEFPEKLFTYNGKFKINKVFMYEENLKVTAEVTSLIHHYDKLNANYTNLHNEWNDYQDEYRYGEDVFRKKTDIVTNNLKTVSGNLVLADGTQYIGDVHFHSEGYFMTGAEHNEDSVRLYEINKKRIVKNKIIRAKQLRRNDV